MLLNAMNQFQLAKREHSEASKAQYTDKGEVKNYFRASELGMGDRKILYGFFKHQLHTTPKSAKNLRQLENGDYVHQRYQKAWEDMGALISMEQRLSSKDDEYLKDFDFEWAGHYDGELDMNVLRAHALGLCTINSVKNEETEEWELEVDLDEAFAAEVGIFEEGYEPTRLVADIKTMNPWGFKRIKEGNISEIGGYIDQISFYMYMLNTPYGSIFIEDKGSNELVEVQIVWKDLHGDDYSYTFDPELHGEAVNGIVRTTIDNERFYGSETVEGLVPRIQRLWETKKALEEADANNGDLATIMPPRCSEEPSKFPCSWGDGKEKCEFYDHCWNQATQGAAIKPYEACPAECIWEIANLDSDGEVYRIDSRKVPEGVTIEALSALYAMRAMDISKFLVDEDNSVPIMEAEETAMNVDHIFGAGGELNLGAPAAPAEGEAGAEAATEAKEYKNAAGKKAIHCLNCGKELTYEKLANGGTKKCNFCNHVNKVAR